VGEREAWLVWKSRVQSPVGFPIACWVSFYWIWVLRRDSQSVGWEVVASERTASFTEEISFLSAQAMGLLRRVILLQILDFCWRETLA
jgi:hypothetical protein